MQPKLLVGALCILTFTTGCASFQSLYDSSMPSESDAISSWSTIDDMTQSYSVRSDEYIWKKINPTPEKCYDRKSRPIDSAQCAKAKKLLSTRNLNFHASKMDCAVMEDKEKFQEVILEAATDCINSITAAQINRKSVSSTDYSSLEEVMPNTLAQLRNDLKAQSQKEKQLLEKAQSIRSAIKPSQNADNASSSPEKMEKLNAFKKVAPMKYKLTESQLRTELIRNDGVGGIGFDLVTTLFLIENSSAIDNIKHSQYQNKLGTHLIVSAQATASNAPIKIHFIIQPKHTVLQGITAKDEEAGGAGAVMLLGTILNEQD